MMSRSNCRNRSACRRPRQLFLTRLERLPFTPSRYKHRTGKSVATRCPFGRYAFHVASSTERVAVFRFGFGCIGTGLHDLSALSNAGRILLQRTDTRMSAFPCFAFVARSSPRSTAHTAKDDMFAVGPAALRPGECRSLDRLPSLATPPECSAAIRIGIDRILVRPGEDCRATTWWIAVPVTATRRGKPGLALTNRWPRSNGMGMSRCKV